MRCPKCSLENENDAVFCIYCGWKIRVKPTVTKIAASEQTPKKSFKKGYLFLFLCLITVSSIIGSYFLLSTYLSSSKIPAKSEKTQQPLQETTTTLPVAPAAAPRKPIEPAPVPEKPAGAPSPAPAPVPAPVSPPAPPPVLEKPKKPPTPNNQETIDRYLRLGKAFHDDGNYDRAIEMFNKALRIDRKNEEALMGKRNAQEAKEIIEGLDR